MDWSIHSYIRSYQHDLQYRIHLVYFDFSKHWRGICHQCLALHEAVHIAIPNKSVIAAPFAQYDRDSKPVEHTDFIAAFRSSRN
jgi:hypothetical protein